MYGIGIGSGPDLEDSGPTPYEGPGSRLGEKGFGVGARRVQSYLLRRYDWRCRERTMDGAHVTSRYLRFGWSSSEVSSCLEWLLPGGLAGHPIRMVLDMSWTLRDLTWTDFEVSLVDFRVQTVGVCLDFCPMGVFGS